MKKIWIHILIGALIGSVFSALPAQAAPEVPETANIEDPLNDANTTSGNNEGPDDASTVGDLMKVWFTNDASTVSVHILTEAPPPSTTGTVYEVFTNQTEGFEGYMNGCLRFLVLIPSNAATGGPYQGDQLVKLVDRCNDEGTSIYNNGAEGELTIEELEDGTGLQTATFPRDYSPLLADAASLTTPQARSSLPIGGDEEIPEVGRVGMSSMRIDDTVIGTDYTIGADGQVEPPKPPKTDPPVKKGCKKGKGKKKGCKKPKLKGCAAYQPGEMGAEAETVKVTDAATEEAPLEVTVTQAEGMGNDLGAGQYDGTTHQYLNLQVDPSKAKEVGLYIRYEFPEYEDHDLYVHYADGSEAAHVGGFNQFPFIPANDVFATDGTGAGGHSEQGAEQLDGLRTADCAGYTLDLVNFLGAGGDYTVKIWFGEIQNDPAVPAEPEA